MLGEGSWEFQFRCVQRKMLEACGRFPAGKASVRKMGVGADLGATEKETINRMGKQEQENGGGAAKVRTEAMRHK